MDTTHSDVIMTVCSRCKQEVPCIIQEAAAEYMDTAICERCTLQIFEEYKQRILDQMSEANKKLVQSQSESKSSTTKKQSKTS
jgi:predicted transcriptional regulator